MPPQVFTQPVPLPSVTRLELDSGQTLRDHLRRLGIESSYRVIDFALLQQRLDRFDFDVISTCLLYTSPSPRDS